MKKPVSRIKELRRLVRLHANWLLFVTVGRDILSDAEFSELEAYGKLPLDKPVSLIDKAYFLGRIRAVKKKAEYAQVQYTEVEKEPISELEKLVLEQARIKAGSFFKRLATELDSAVSDGSNVIFSEALGEETASAIEQNLSADQFASQLAARFQQGLKKDWLRVARTELHRAKTSGQAQAILNKVDIYAHNGGPGANVSVVPGPNCCVDCSKLYLDDSGNPKIFKLADLLAAGSNSDPGVVHTKTGGIHTKWKATLPPLHPNCGCTLQFVPPGYSWKDGKLALLNKSLFEADLLKASGVRGGISSTVKPEGPPKADISTAPAGKVKVENNVPSMPGAAAPGNVPGPGRPPESGGLPQQKTPAGGGPGGGSGGNTQFSPCPFGGGADCMKHGGNGASAHKQGGTIMRKHQEAMARGARPATPEAEEQNRKAQDAQAKVFNSQPNPRDVVLDHLSEGEISSATPLKQAGEARGKGGGGAFESYRVTIKGNGRACLKPPASFDDRYYSAAGATGDGLYAVPRHRGHCSEHGAHLLGSSLGISVPVTTRRTVNGEHGIPAGEVSIQQWQEDYTDASMLDNKLPPELARHNKKNIVAALIAENPQLKERFSEIAVLDFVMNNCDRHEGNLVVSKDFKDVQPIDHGSSFGAGLQEHKNAIAHYMHQDGHKLEMPPALLTKLKAHSLEDTKRSLEGSGLTDWQVMNVHLRKKYAVYLQEKHGHIPESELRHVQYDLQEGDSSWPHPGGLMAFGRSDGKSRLDLISDLKKEADANQLPDQKFASWSKSYIIKNLLDDSSPEKDDAFELRNSFPLLKPSTAWDMPNKYAREAYWNEIPKYNEDTPAEQVATTKHASEGSVSGFHDTDIQHGPQYAGDKTVAHPSLPPKKIEYSTNVVSPHAMKKKAEAAKEAAKDQIKTGASKFDRQKIEAWAKEREGAGETESNPAKGTKAAKIKKSLLILSDVHSVFPGHSRTPR